MLDVFSPMQDAYLDLAFFTWYIIYSIFFMKKGRGVPITRFPTQNAHAEMCGWYDMQVDTSKFKLDPIQMKSTPTHTWNLNIWSWKVWPFKHPLNITDNRPPDQKVLEAQNKYSLSTCHKPSDIGDKTWAQAGVLTWLVKEKSQV